MRFCFILFIFFSNLIYSQSDIDKILKGGEIIVNGLSFLKKAKSEGLKINYYLLNCDIQKEWNIEKSQSAKVKIK